MRQIDLMALAIRQRISIRLVYRGDGGRKVNPHALGILNGCRRLFCWQEGKGFRTLDIKHIQGVTLTDDVFEAGGAVKVNKDKWDEIWESLV